jgi:hypothetical protein
LPRVGSGAELTIDLEPSGGGTAITQSIDE